ncbi:MAG: type IX secretion system sortase PorU [Chitinophagales bacterium]|nr:type IX secretion system sortase PorU [Chitinophagales bacterium]
MVKDIQLPIPTVENNQVSFKNSYQVNALDMPSYIYSFPINENGFTFQMSNKMYEKLSVNLSNTNINILNDTSFIAIEKKQKIGKVVINPYKIENGSVYFLKSCTVNIQTQNNANGNRSSQANNTYASNSVLANGAWYEFSVNQAGVFKIDYTFLQSLGVNPSTVNPNQIKVYGKNGGMLSEIAGTNYIDDLQEYPIKKYASGNSFQSNDYILVYCPGPNSWYYDNSINQFRVTKHLYSNTQHLFLTIDNGNSITLPTVSGSGLTPNTSSNSYNAITFVEDELVNVARSGRLQLGDDLFNQQVKNYNFNVANIISAKISLGLAANSVVSSNFNIAIGSNNSTASISAIPQVYPGIYNFASYKQANYSYNNLSSNFSVDITYNSSDFASKAWLDYINIDARANLVYNGTPLYFRDIQSVGSGKITQFNIQNTNNNIQIWEVTNPFDVKQISYSLNGSTASFVVNTDELREFVCFENSNLTPTAIGKISNQNLHALTAQDMLIVTRQAFLNQANAIAQLHRNNDNYRVAVVTLEQVYNEFSAGTNDITAIRDFVKMFYDRAGSNANDLPKYLLLFGDGTYHNNDLGQYYLPTYQSKKTFEALETYTSDDYFGLLDDGEGSNIDNTAVEIVDIGIGRIPSDNMTKAQIAVDKISRYYDNVALGSWRTQATFLADDEDNNIHIADADFVANLFASALPKYNLDKIYLDAYNQVGGTSGNSYPQAKSAVNAKINSGTLFFNYVGHGGGSGLTQEAVVTHSDIDNWNNTDKLPLFITATCEFTRFDEYDYYTAGERTFFNQNGGAIATVSTTRLVFSNRNREMNINFTNGLIEAANQPNLKLGDVLQHAKSVTNTGNGNRKFSLFGDPALRLAFPKENAIITKINNVDIQQAHDTIQALKTITLSGEVRDIANALLTNYNGTATITVYDKMKQVTTLQNDPTSLLYTFNLQKNILFKGKTNIVNGQFEITFLVPKDIDYSYGNGKISIYAENNTSDDACGYTSDIIVGGINDTIILDNKGPEVDVFMNDEQFVFGGITDENPNMYIKLFDENGINTTGNGIGHDITAILDNNTTNIYILNDYYEIDSNSNASGKVLYPLQKLETGKHTLQVKAWDILNNSGEAYTEFIVEEDAALALSHVLNYPNPFTTNTTFMFEHNKPNQDLALRIDIFSASGKLIKTIQQDINTAGYRVADINWDGRDNFGDKIGKGVYIYKLSLKDNSEKKISQYQKLVILN